jgi:hypothetical protein
MRSIGAPEFPGCNSHPVTALRTLDSEDGYTPRHSLGPQLSLPGLSSADFHVQSPVSWGLVGYFLRTFHVSPSPSPCNRPYSVTLTVSWRLPILPDFRGPVGGCADS